MDIELFHRKARRPPPLPPLVTVSAAVSAEYPSAAPA